MMAQLPVPDLVESRRELGDVLMKRTSGLISESRRAYFAQIEAQQRPHLERLLAADARRPAMPKTLLPIVEH